MGTGSTGLDAAISTFKDVPEGPGVTEVAVPKKGVGFGFDHGEGVVAGRGSGKGHGGQS